MPSASSGTDTYARVTPGPKMTVPTVGEKSPLVAQSSFSALVLTAVDPYAVYVADTVEPLKPMRRTAAVPVVPSLKGPCVVCSNSSTGATGTLHTDVTPMPDEHTKPLSTVQLALQPSPTTAFPSSQFSMLVRAPSPQICTTATTPCGDTSAAASAAAATTATAESPAAAAALAALTGMALAGTNPLTVSVTLAATLGCADASISTSKGGTSPCSVM